MEVTDNVHFVVGHHAVGKTYLLERLSQNFKLLHIDTGPVIRELYKKDTNQEIDIETWVKQREDQYGSDFTDYIIYKEIEKKIAKAEPSPVFITGNRSLNGIKYIAERLNIMDEMKIIYIDAPFDLLKSNYEEREDTEVDTKELELMLKKEAYSGIDELKEYVLQHPDKCMYHFKESNNDVLYNKLKRKLSLSKNEKSNGGFERE